MTESLSSQTQPPDDATCLLTWDDVSRALDTLIDRSSRTLDIVDHSLATQGWGSRARCDALQEAAFHRRVQVRILIAEGHYVRTEVPRLMTVLKSLGHRIEIVVSQARDFPASAYAVADRQHLLFRPISVQSNGRLSLENPNKSIPYADEFHLLWEQGGERVFPEAFGL
ncbi:MAG: hypothetical protein JNL19_10425 [Burkholderiales bacterium]|nr:hypothetical protein [Burkholderiales bacterium]